MILIEFALATTAEQRARCVEALTRQMQASRVEPGCLSYRFTADLEDPLVFHLVELWENEAMLIQHLKTPGFAAFVADMPTFGQRLSSVWRSGALEPYTMPRDR